MALAVKNKGKEKKEKTFAIVDNRVGDYEKHPFFVKKANEVKTLIKEVGLPKKSAGTK